MDEIKKCRIAGIAKYDISIVQCEGVNKKTGLRCNKSTMYGEKYCNCHINRICNICGLYMKQIYKHKEYQCD